MLHREQFKNGFLAKLIADRAGNTLAIVAAATLPMMAIIGGGVDISRAYMTKTQLQAACDSGVLAGRRAMAISGEYGTDERDTADRMFNFNYDGDSVQARDVSFVTDDNSDGQVTGTATATMPTVVMKIFGKNTIDLTVDCMAELQIGNVDVMFVLDTTGSMGSSISWGEPTKIEGLRDAVRDFHRTINQAINDNRTRVRYGFVPYSMTVNVGGLIADGELPTDYLRDITPYQSRLAVFDTPVNVAEDTETLSDETETYASNISENDCYSYADNYGNNPVTSGSAPGVVTTTEYDLVQFDRKQRVGSGRNRYWIGTCTRRVWTTRTTYSTEYQFTKWRYTQVDLDTSQAKTLASVPYASYVSSSSRTETRGAYDPIRLAEMVSDGTASNITVSNSTWDGCIEERETISPTTTIPDFYPVPDGAYDLDFDLVPDSEQTRWRPHWADMEFSRSNYTSEDSTSNRSHVSNNCPAEMMLLRTVDLSDNPDDVPTWLDTYLNNLRAEGNTYHDLGMIWGGRLTSPTGLFADNVNLDADKLNVSHHIIFMTDGQMQPTTSGYSAYGIENLDNRISPRNYESTITARHNARFAAMCSAIRAQGTTIWVIAFGTSMTTELQNCASSGRAYYSSNTEALRSTFKYIAAQVADLRLGK
ncbi:MAG: pilus assembly protein TadG-related protein [Novosphingobium sp.]|nr:pilus assembly protein TadG-related protein [Novosphingobium sp.]